MYLLVYLWKSFYEGEARVRLRNIKKKPKDSTPKKQQQEYTKLPRLKTVDVIGLSQTSIIS